MFGACVRCEWKSLDIVKPSPPVPYPLAVTFYFVLFSFRRRRLAGFTRLSMNIRWMFRDVVTKHEAKAPEVCRKLKLKLNWERLEIESEIQRPMFSTLQSCLGYPFEGVTIVPKGVERMFAGSWKVCTYVQATRGRKTRLLVDFSKLFQWSNVMGSNLLEGGRSFNPLSPFLPSSSRIWISVASFPLCQPGPTVG